MGFFNTIKTSFAPEERIKQHLLKAQKIARENDYIILPTIINNIINDLRKDNTSNLCQRPSNDNDINGIYNYLIWSASRSGWASDKLGYIAALYRKAISDK